jgi:uncharacterized protein (DUF1778 family)
MARGNRSDARINFRLPAALKNVVEEAAAALGQSVSDYAISTLVTNSRIVLQQSQLTTMSSHDREIFMALLDDAGAKPNKALAAAAKRYNKWRTQ